MSRAVEGAFRGGAVSVAVPATSANLGPGFDCLGVALDRHDRLRAEVGEPGVLEIEISGEGADDLPRDEGHLVVRSMRALFDRVGVAQPGLRARFENAIPQSRGLGSSSAAIVGGLALARALLAEPERADDALLLDLATEIEGHPDNVAPALLGGFVVCGRHPDGSAWAVQPPLDTAIRAVVFVPPAGVSTEAARGLLPPEVPHADAAANAGRAALLVAALGGHADRLLEATEDRLHQDYRRPAMPDSHALMTRLREAGHAAAISGAGPTVVVLAAGDPGQALALCPRGWSAAIHSIDHDGARVVTR